MSEKREAVRKLKVKKLRSLAAYIRECVSRSRNLKFDMEKWLEVGGFDRFPSSEDEVNSECNTVACAAGFTLLREGFKNVDVLKMSSEYPVWFSCADEVLMSEKGVPGKAAKILGLNAKQARDLFFTAYWPADLAIRHGLEANCESTTQEARLSALEERIERLISEAKS